MCGNNILQPRPRAAEGAQWRWPLPDGAASTVGGCVRSERKCALTGGCGEGVSFSCGVLLMGDRLVSWGDDGAIRFWSDKGEPIELVVVPGDIAGTMMADQERLVVPGRTIWIYNIQANTNRE